MLFQLYSDHAAMQLVGWVLVFCGLILMNEIGRRTKAGGMLVFFHEGESVAAQKILIRDDGARISPDSWSVEWEDGGCRVTVRGSEMDDEEYYFPFR